MKHKNDMKTETVAARVSTELRRRILKHAKRRKEKPSDIIRKAVIFYLAQN